MNNSFEQINYELDDLTQIYNRKAFYVHTKELINARKDMSFLICAINVDRFKIINDLFGTMAGDKVLVYIADALKEYIDGDKNCVYGRMHADAFLMCLPEAEDRDREISEYLDKKMADYPLPLNIYIKCGIYHIHNQGVPVEIMCDRANMAIAQIKGKFSVNYNTYDEELRKQILQEQEINNEMINALEDNQFMPYYQPKFNMESGKVIGAEALVRWIHPEKGLISPGIFIPVFEKNGFIANLDRYIWERVCADISSWIRNGYGICPISVNVSRAELYDVKLPQILLDLVNKYQIPIGLLQLEITESAYTNNPEQMINAVENLKKAGFTILMDDFGSGYSSLNTLKDIPIDVLKLDLKFLYDMDGNKKADNILKSVVQMAKRLSLSVIAEGVENKDQVDFLKSVGCLKAQGYFYSRPIPRTDFEEFLKDKENVSLKDEDYREGLINVDDIIGKYNREDEVEWYRSAVIMLHGTLFEYDLLRDTLTIFDMAVDSESNELQKLEMPNFISDNLVDNYVHKDDIDALLDFMKDPEGGTIELRMKSTSTKDSAYRWFRITDHPAKNDDGEIISIVGVFLNVSGNYQARALMSVMNIFAENASLSDKLSESAAAVINAFNVDYLRLEFPKKISSSELASVEYYKDGKTESYSEGSLSSEELSKIHNEADEYNIFVRSSDERTEVLYLDDIDEDYTGLIRFVFECKDRKLEEYDKRQISEVCRCVLTNIEKRIRARREKQHVEMYAHAFSSSRVMLREWDIKTKTLIRSDGYSEKDGRDRVIYNVPESLIADGYVHPDFVDAYRKTFENLEKGIDQVLMVKIKGKSGCYEWMWVDYKVIHSDDGTPIKAIGTGQDVNSIFVEQQAMRKRLKLEKHIVPGAISWINVDLTENRIIDASGDVSAHIVKTDKYSELCEHIAIDHVVDEDREEYINHFSLEAQLKAIHNGESIISMKYRMKHDDGSYQWRETDVDLYQSRIDGHFKAFAYVRDVGMLIKWQGYVDGEIKRNHELHVYHGETFEKMVNRILEKENCDDAAMLLVDMDRFGVIRETFGEKYTKEILRNIITIIKATIRPGMVIGQIYEDRFAIFVQKVVNRKEMYLLSNALQKRIFNAFHAGDEDYILSASIGLSYNIEMEEHTYQAMYDVAEEILNDAKSSLN